MPSDVSIRLNCTFGAELRNVHLVAFHVPRYISCQVARRNEFVRGPCLPFISVNPHALNQGPVCVLYSVPPCPERGGNS